jgi:heme/copper-type cytochrome/quinol oxidase subunit 2
MAIFIFGVAFVLIICIFAFIATFQLGRKQNKQHNQQYDQSRTKTLLLLSFIYLITILLGVFFIYYFIFAK